MTTIILTFTRDENGVITIERELTKEERSKLIATHFKLDTVEYVFNN